MKTITCILLAFAGFLFVQAPNIVDAATQPPDYMGQIEEAINGPRPMTQEWFLQFCEEDEVIGFVEGNFEHVECIHREAFG